MAPLKTSPTGDDVVETQVALSSADGAGKQSASKGMFPFTLDRLSLDINHGLVNEPDQISQVAARLDLSALVTATNLDGGGAFNPMHAAGVAYDSKAQSGSSGVSTQVSSSRASGHPDNEGGVVSAAKLRKIARKHFLAGALVRIVDQAEKLVGLDDGASPGPSTSVTAAGAATPAPAPAPAPSPSSAHEGLKDRTYSQFSSKILEGVAKLGPESQALSQMIWILANLVRDAYTILKTLTTVMVEDARQCRDEQGRDTAGGPRSAAADNKGKGKEKTDEATEAGEAP